jgi:Glyoxalase-like domain
LEKWMSEQHAIRHKRPVILGIDHVVMLVPDAVETAASLRRRHGLGSERGTYYPFAGTRNHTVPLQPPAYLEFLTIENRAVAEATEAGRVALACEAAGFGLFSWAVLVDDLEAVSQRLAIEIVDYTVPHGDGTLRGWRTVAGPASLPFFIDYPNNGDRVSRLQAAYKRVGHTSSPTGFSELTISGSESELLDWLGPHDLPLRFIRGQQGIREARIGTAKGDVIIT